MKKIVILWAMIFISLHTAFSDENLYINENVFFPWQLYNYYINKNNDILPAYPFESGILFKISLDDYNRYLTYTNPSFYDYIYLINESAGYFIYSTLQVFELIYNIYGGPERRRREQIESDRRYNILNPTEPPRNTNY